MRKIISEVKIIEPVPVQPGQNRDFGQKRSYEIHPGEDFYAKPGTPVLAMMDGEVVYTNPNVRLCGATIDIDYKNGYWSRFCHMSRIDVKVGDTVKQGQVVGLSGGVPGSWGAGNSTGPHLHLTLRLNNINVDPVEHINSNVSDAITPSDTEASDKDVEDAKDIVSKLDLKSNLSFDEYLKNLDTAEVRKLFQRSILGPFAEEVKRIKQLIK